MPASHVYSLPILCLAIGSASVSAHERENQSPVKHPADGSDAAFVVQTGWDSRYHSEGRDNLDGDSLWRSSVEWSRGLFAVGAWYGNSPDRAYDELQLSVATTATFGDFATYLGYTHLRLPFDGTHDHELGAGAVFSGCPLGVELAADIYHSLEADGFFAEAAVSRGWELSEKLGVDLSAVFGVNQGYVADGHDGANHVALSISLSYALTQHLSVVAHGTQSWAVDRKASAAGDAPLKDFFHGGLGLEWEF